MERRYLGYGHTQQFRIKVRRLLVVALDGFGRQLLVHVLAKELLQQHRQCHRERSRNAGARFCEIPLSLFFGPTDCLGVLSLTFGCEAGFCDSSALLPRGAGRVELVEPDYLPGAVFTFVD